MNKLSFAQLNKETQINRTTTPMMVSLTQSPDEETREMMIQRHTKFLSLPEKTRDKLASIKTSQKIQAIGQKYGFELLRLANITRLIREYYFGEVRFEDFATEIEKRMGVSLLTAQEITRYIKSEIIDWDPWAEYIAKLPKHSVREIVAKFPKLAEMEITGGYVELKGNDELLDPTIKNWVHDYILHVGQAEHPQMERTQYLFHSENGKNLSSPDREKLGIILRSFDENIPLPVDEENSEIIFDGMIAEPASSADKQQTVTNRSVTTNIPKPQPIPQPSFVPPSGTTAGKQESFIKPYSPVQQPRPTTSPQPSPYKGERVRPTPTQNFVKPTPAPQPQLPAQMPPPSAKIPYKVTSSDPEMQPTSPQPSPYQGEGDTREIDKYFNAPESHEIPEIKIHSMTEHNEPKPAPKPFPQPNIQRPLPPQTSPQPSPYQGEGERPKYKIIDPFEPRISEPRLDGNIVDLSSQE